ncbi:hypothetical protein ABPG75_001682 [Micractinium tetrahymenae]
MAECPECPICLEALAGGALLLSCGHSLHSRCLLACFADEPVTSWRCPVCRSTVDPGGVAAAAELPEEAGAALLDEEQAECGGGGSKGAKPASSSRAAAWVLAAAERLLPEPALAAAATGLAAMRLRQLLHPKEPPGGLAGAIAAWAAALLFLAGGAALGALLLGRFIACGLLALCQVNQRAAAAAGLLADRSACSLLAAEPPTWIVALLCTTSLLVVAEAERQRAPRGGLLPALVLRLEARAPRCLLSLYAVAFGLASAILAISLLLNMAALAASWAMGSIASPYLIQPAAWQHQQQQLLLQSAPLVDVGGGIDLWQFMEQQPPGGP